MSQTLVIVQTVRIVRNELGFLITTNTIIAKRTATLACWGLEESI